MSRLVATFCFQFVGKKTEVVCDLAAGASLGECLAGCRQETIATLQSFEFLPEELHVIHVEGDKSPFTGNKFARTQFLERLGGEQWVSLDGCGNPI